MKNNNIHLTKEIHSAVEKELKSTILKIDGKVAAPFLDMLRYHMGWTGDGAGIHAQGKRFRSLLLLLTTAACGGDWRSAVPAAAAVELVHNFSLVHDDIQDNSSLRRGRETVWKKWGMPAGINVGDALFVLSNLAVVNLQEKFPHILVVPAVTILNNACLELTEGQYLDLTFEESPKVSLDEYWQMIGRKTAALISASAQLGALLGGADVNTQNAYRSFGHFLGLAFQVQDDYLGIWGDPRTMGKSSKSDLINRKKSLPILFGISKSGEFAKRWQAGGISEIEVPLLSNLLSDEGGKQYTLETINHMMDQAMKNLQAANPKGEAGEVLKETAINLLGRKA